jgi:hypothetical protein
MNEISDTMTTYYICTNLPTTKAASTELSGMFYDNAVRLVGLFWNAKNYIFDE